MRCARKGAVLVAAIATAGLACSAPERGPRWQGAGATTPRRGGTLRVATLDGVVTLDPAIAYDEFSFYALIALFDRLVDYAPGSTELVPRLAARWTVSADATEYRFWLRPGITYADGRPIVAADFVYALERALTTPASPFGPLLADVDGAPAVLAGTTAHAAGLVAVGDHELVIRLTRPNVAFLAVLAMPFATPQRADHVAAAGPDLRRRPLASGPFVLERWDEGERLVLAKNPRYHDAARVHLDRVVSHERRPADTQFLMFEAGELDASQLAPPDYLWIKTQPAWAPFLEEAPMLFSAGSRFNVRRPPFDDRRVRQAFNYALDKAHVVKVMQGRAIASHGMLPPGVLGRDDQLAPYPHDPARARALLAEAGYPHGLDVAYLTPRDEQLDRLALTLQADLAEAGIRVTLRPTALGSLFAEVGRPDGAALSWTSWQADFGDPAAFLDARFHSRAIADEASPNDSFYASPALDAVLDRARAERDPVRRAAAYREADRILHDDAPWLWGYHPINTGVVQPYVRGLAFHPVWIRVYADAWLDVGPDGRPLPARGPR